MKPGAVAPLQNLTHHAGHWQCERRAFAEVLSFKCYSDYFLHKVKCWKVTFVLSNKREEFTLKLNGEKNLMGKQVLIGWPDPNSPDVGQGVWLWGTMRDATADTKNAFWLEMHRLRFLEPITDHLSLISRYRSIEMLRLRFWGPIPITDTFFRDLPIPIPIYFQMEILNLCYFSLNSLTHIKLIILICFWVCPLFNNYD